MTNRETAEADFVLCLHTEDLPLFFDFMKRHFVQTGIFLFLTAGAVLLLASCGRGGDPSRDPYGAAAVLPSGNELVIYCPHPLDFINPIVSEFEEQTGIPVYVQTGGTGELLAMVEEHKEPACDIFWGGSLSSNLPKKELFEQYISKNESMVQEEFKNKEGSMTRFTDIPSVLMVNTNLTGGLVIEGYEDLLKPELKGKIAMCNPSTSSSAYEHLINMLYAMGGGAPEDGWDYVEAFCENLDGTLLKSSSEVYQGVARGRFAVGLTFEEGAARYVEEDGPVRLVYMKEGVISKPDVVCIAKGTGHMEEAKEFVDFVTGRDAQAMIASTLNRRSVRVDVKEAEYLPAKDSIHMIYDEATVVNQNKKEWQGHFMNLFIRASGREGREEPGE